MEQVMEMPNLQAAGLMNIAPLEGEPEQWFAQMSALAEQRKRKAFR